MKKNVFICLFILFAFSSSCSLANNNKSIDVMFNYPFYKKPSNTLRTSSAQILYEELKNEQNSLELMIYGISKQPEILNQIIYLCNNPNIKVRGIVDINSKKSNDYADTYKLLKKCKCIKKDFSKKYKNYTPKEQNKELRYIMHNKVFVFTNNHTWTGSTNISSTGTGGYNSNVAYLIKDEQIANKYRKEIARMYNDETFHKDKMPVSYNNIFLKDGTNLDLYFSPNQEILTKAILPNIQQATNTIDIAMFYLTHRDIIEELIKAEKRGVKIRLILDASYAQNYRYLINRLRDSNMQVKVENWAGKMHNKLAIIDNKVILTGSLNWTYSALNNNDENFLVIKNKSLANEHTKYFNTLWNSIDDKWLNRIPKAEGYDSKGSCEDGIDNDYDGLIDKKDPNCYKH